MAKEDVASREARLEERTSFLDAKEKDISSREENLMATLHGKDDELEGLVHERTKELEGKHKAALDAVSSESVAQLKNVDDN